VRGLDLEHFEPALERAARAAQLGLFDRRDPRQQLDRLRPDDERALRAQQPDEIAPHPVLLVQRLEHADDAHHHELAARRGHQLFEQLARLRVIAVARQHVLEQIDRARRVVELVRE
jgi:hypothetical protein